MNTISGALLVVGITAFAAAPAVNNPAHVESELRAPLQISPLTEEDRRCDLRPGVIAELVQGREEQRVATGVLGNGNHLELFSSPHTGTWSVVVSLPSGVSCVATEGESFRTLPDRVARRGLREHQ